MKTSIIIRKQAQAGFTLIELIVVIVILGILAATALPKFTSLGGEARVASLNAVKGSLMATSAMIHGKALVNSSAIDATAKTLTVEGVAVPMNTTTLYPTATVTLAEAAGLAATDYDVYTKATATGTNVPVVGDNQIAVVPVSLKGTANASKCFVLFTAPTAANNAPTAVMSGTVDLCQ
jgi:MSHA pilin protein MshA